MRSYRKKRERCSHDAGPRKRTGTDSQKERGENHKKKIKRERGNESQNPREERKKSKKACQAKLLKPQSLAPKNLRKTIAARRIHQIRGQKPPLADRRTQDDLAAHQNAVPTETF